MRRALREMEVPEVVEGLELVVRVARIDSLWMERKREIGAEGVGVRRRLRREVEV